MPNAQRKIKKSKRKIELAPEERERRRENVIKLTQEGKMGAQFGKLGGRPRKPRAAERVAELAREHADEIAAAFLNALGEDQPPYTQLQAAKEWLSIENKEAELQLKEDRAFEDASKDEIIEYLAHTIAELQESGEFPSFIDGDAVEEEPQRVIGSGSTGEET